MTGSLRAIAARGHVAPPAPPILRLVLEDATASRIRAASYPNELAEDEGIGGALDHWNQQARKGITDRNERAHERPVAPEFQPSRACTAPEHSIDLGHRLRTDVMRPDASLGQCPEHRAHAARIAQHGERAGGLLVRSPTHARRALRVQQVSTLEPAHESLEIVQPIISTKGTFRVYEIEPESFRDERERVPITLVEV